MTDTPYDRAPGEISTTAEAQRLTLSDFGIYTVGFVLAVILTAVSFWVANTSLLWAPGVAMGLVVLAIAQMGVHLVFFLHITTGSDNTNNVLALAFGMLIVFLVVVGSLWIMTNLNDNLMPSQDLLNLHMQHGPGDVKQRLVQCPTRLICAQHSPKKLQATTSHALIWSPRSSSTRSRQVEKPSMKHGSRRSPLSRHVFQDIKALASCGHRPAQTNIRL